MQRSSQRCTSSLMKNFDIYVEDIYHLLTHGWYNPQIGLDNQWCPQIYSILVGPRYWWTPPSLNMLSDSFCNARSKPDHHLQRMDTHMDNILALRWDSLEILALNWFSWRKDLSQLTIAKGTVSTWSAIHLAYSMEILVGAKVGRNFAIRDC